MTLKSTHHWQMQESNSNKFKCGNLSTRCNFKTCAMWVQQTTQMLIDMWSRFIPEHGEDGLVGRHPSVWGVWPAGARHHSLTPGRGFGSELRNPVGRREIFPRFFSSLKHTRSLSLFDWSITSSFLRSGRALKHRCVHTGLRFSLTPKIRPRP